MEQETIKTQKLLFSWNNLFEAILWTHIYMGFLVKDRVIFVKVGNLFWFWLAGLFCFCPVVIPILVTYLNISKAKNAIQTGNISFLTSNPENLSVEVSESTKPMFENGLMGQECIIVSGNKIYSHFLLDKKGLKLFVDQCWSQNG